MPSVGMKPISRGASGRAMSNTRMPAVNCWPLSVSAEEPEKYALGSTFMVHTLGPLTANSRSPWVCRWIARVFGGQGRNETCLGCLGSRTSRTVMPFE